MKVTLAPSFPFVNPLRALALSFARERPRWSYWLPVALVGGIVLYFSLPFEPPWATVALVPFMGGVSWAMHRRSWGTTLVLFALALVCLGFAAAQIETRLAETPMLDTDLPAVTMTGRVAMTDILPDGIRLTLSHPVIETLSADQTPERIHLKVKDLTLDEAPPTGSQIHVFGRVGAFSEPVAPGAADFRRDAYFKHLGGMGWLYGKIDIVDPTPSPFSWHESIALALERARKTLARHVYERLPGDIAAMTATRLNGEQTAISAPVIEAMRVAGLAHLLSTSGFHVTIMGLLIYFPLRGLLALFPSVALRHPIKKWAAGAAIVSAFGYTLLVGAQAATLRSMIMTGLAMLAITLDRRTTALRLVMLSAGLGMVMAPDAVMGASFQMSFAAVFCLIVANKESWEWFSIGEGTGLRGFLAHMGGILRTSLIATAATTPFAVYHFQTFSPYGFLANMLAIPITSFWVMPSIIFAYLTAPFRADGVFIDAAGLGVALTIRIATMIAALPYAVFSLPAMPGVAFVAIILGGLWLCLWREKWRYLGLVPVVIGMLYPLYTRQPDFFMAPDGKEWAVRLDDGRLAASNIKHDKFAVIQWQQRLGNVPITDVAALPDDDPHLRCDEEGCVYRKDPLILAMPLVESAALEDCAHASIVIAHFPIAPCGADKVIDQMALEQHGAAALYFTSGKPRLVFSHKTRGARPWSPGWREGR